MKETPLKKGKEKKENERDTSLKKMKGEKRKGKRYL